MFLSNHACLFVEEFVEMIFRKRNDFRKMGYLDVLLLFSENSNVMAYVASMASSVASKVTTEVGVSVTTTVLSTLGGALAATALSYILKFIGLRLHRLVNDGNKIFNFDF